MEKHLLEKLIKLQTNEITEFKVYSNLAKLTKDEHNKEVLLRIANDEYGHSLVLQKLTQKEVKPQPFKVYWYTVISHIFGLSFGLKLMENGEELATEVYTSMSSEIEVLEKLALDEQTHEKELLNILQEERLDYAGSMVLGLNDALVELTGALAGLTFALQNSKLVALTGLITGFAASLSMAASGYLSSREDSSDGDAKEPLKSALYTGVAYIITVALLIAPYFIFANIYISFVVMLTTGILIIFSYTFYISTAKDLNFWKRFTEMALISISVALLSFLAGFALKAFLGVEF